VPQGSQRSTANVGQADEFSGEEVPELLFGFGFGLWTVCKFMTCLWLLMSLSASLREVDT